MAKLVTEKTQYSGENGRFLREYTDKKLSQHREAVPIDHPNGSVNLDKLDTETQAYFAKTSDTDAHIASKANPHGVTKTQVGLGNADNTADMDKPISTAMRAALDTKQEKEAGKGLSAENYTAAEKEKLAGVEAGANAYTHPQTHAAAMIEQDDARQFVTAAEKETWNAKAAPEDIRAGENVNVSVANGKVTISATGGGEGGGVTVADDLTSTSPVSALSANQGRVLNEKIDELNSDLGRQIAEKADVSHEHTSADISDFPTLQAGENIEVSRDGNDVTISAPTVDSKLEADDIVAGENITLEKADGKVTVSATGGRQEWCAEYRKTGTWYCPPSVTQVTAVVIGGGGGGGGRDGNNYTKGGGGGGGGYANIYKDINVTPGTEYDVVVGAGGKGASTGVGGSGGTSYFFSDTYHAEGGGGGTTGTETAVGAGGSGQAGGGGGGTTAATGGNGLLGEDGSGTDGGAGSGTPLSADIVARVSGGRYEICSGGNSATCSNASAKTDTMLVGCGGDGAITASNSTSYGGHGGVDGGVYIYYVVE